MNIFRRIGRVGLGDFTQRGNRVGRFALFEESQTEIVARSGVVRIEPQGFLQVLDGIVGLAFAELANGEEVAGLRVRWQRTDDFLEIIGGTCVFLFFEAVNAGLELFVGTRRAVATESE